MKGDQGAAALFGLVVNVLLGIDLGREEPDGAVIDLYPYAVRKKMSIVFLIIIRYSKNRGK